MRTTWSVWRRDVNGWRDVSPSQRFAACWRVWSTLVPGERRIMLNGRAVKLDNNDQQLDLFVEVEELPE